MEGFELTKLCIRFDFGRSNAVAKSVLIALASHYNEDNGKVWPGSEVLCREAACQRNALFNAIKWLREVGLIGTKRTWMGNVYTFNYALLRRGEFERSIESNTHLSIESDTNVSIENVTKESIESDTSVSSENDTCLSIESNTRQSIESDTRTNKEQIKEQKINQEIPSISSCFNSFGQNPVQRPTHWEPDENDYDLPIKTQLALNRKVDVDINDLDHVLTATEIIVLAADLGFRLTHNVLIDEVAARKTLTVKMLAEACQRTRDNLGGIGYLVRVIQNASKNPNAFLGIRKEKEMTADTINDGQCFAFAKKLGNYHPFASKNAKTGEEMPAFIERIADRLKDKEFFEHCRPTLVKLGCIKGATA